jgi:hypothetical protein
VLKDNNMEIWSCRCSSSRTINFIQPITPVPRSWTGFNLLNFCSRSLCPSDIVLLIENCFHLQQHNYRSCPQPSCTFHRVLCGSGILVCAAWKLRKNSYVTGHNWHGRRSTVDVVDVANWFLCISHEQRERRNSARKTTERHSNSWRLRCCQFT